VFNRFFGAELDPNDWRVQEHREDMYIYALFTGNSQRFGTRELIEETAAALSNKLIIKTHTLVTRMLFSATAAIGAEYLKADPRASQEGLKPRPRQTMFASGEVTLAAGAFNSPAILKLSDIGPAEEMTNHGIKVLVNLPGVSENLQASLMPLMRRGRAFAPQEALLTAGMYLVGCASNVCWFHQSLRLAAPDCCRGQTHRLRPPHASSWPMSRRKP
jgi:choline dehydrogenase-like flavoprotein